MEPRGRARGKARASDEGGPAGRRETASTRLKLLQSFVFLPMDDSTLLARVTHRTEFCAAVRLSHPGLSARENKETYGICASPHGHGHNYLMDVVVEGPIDPATGMVMDFLKLSELVRLRVLEKLDHKNLNEEIEWFHERVPTTENIARYVWDRLETELPPKVELAEIRLQESRDHCITFQGPGRSAR